MSAIWSFFILYWIWSCPLYFTAAFNIVLHKHKLFILKYAGIVGATDATWVRVAEQVTWVRVRVQCDGKDYYRGP